jgi:hypothetical protein
MPEIKAHEEEVQYNVNGLKYMLIHVKMTSVAKDDVTTWPPIPVIPPEEIWIAVTKAIIFVILCVAIIFGNTLVCLAVIRFRRLRKVTNYFIVSLSVADLLVGAFVMPFSATYEVLGWWPFGAFCDIHSSFDVTLCCASLYNLCMVSVDRYIAITSPMTYQSRMTPKVAFILIGVVWVAAFSTFIPMVLGLSREEGFEYEYDNPNSCKFIINKTFAFIITVPPFYIPTLFMVVAYGRMFYIARQQAQQIANLSKVIRQNGDSPSVGGISLRDRSRFVSDHKALRVVITVIGVFMICWMPYFIVFPYDTFCRCVNNLTWSIVLWLGYANSIFNPLIYAFNRDFR